MPRRPGEIENLIPPHKVDVTTDVAGHHPKCSCGKLHGTYTERRDAWKAANDHLGLGWLALERFFVEQETGHGIRESEPAWIKNFFERLIAAWRRT